MSDADDDLPPVRVRWSSRPTTVTGAWLGLVREFGGWIARLRLTRAFDVPASDRRIGVGRIVELDWSPLLTDAVRQIPLGTRADLRLAPMTVSFDGARTYTVACRGVVLTAALPAPPPPSTPPHVCGICGRPLRGAKRYCDSDYCAGEAHRPLVASRRGKHATIP